MTRPATAGAVLALLVALAPAAHADDTTATPQPQQPLQPPAVPDPQTTPQPPAAPVRGTPTPVPAFRWTVFGPARRLAPAAGLTPLHPGPAPVQDPGDPVGIATNRTPLHPGLTAGPPAHPTTVPGSPVPR